MNKTENFIKRAKEIHGDKYNYELVDYKNSVEKVIIICPIHGEFYQSPSVHISPKKHECKKCSYDTITKKTKDNYKHLKKEFKRIHNDIYDYSKVNYVNKEVKIEIICQIHGSFLQTPSQHLKGRGCNKCAIEFRARKLSLTTEEFIKRAVEVHGDAYDYSLVDYKNSYTKVKIICPIHGIIEVLPFGHLINDCYKCSFAKRRQIPEKLKKRLNSIRRRTLYRLKDLDCKKDRNTQDIVGCSWVELKEHLENNPYGFKIDQEGLDLDHINPLVNCKTKEDVYRLSHYTNLQLLPTHYNRNIKRDNPWDKEHFEEWLKNKKS